MSHSERCGTNSLQEICRISGSYGVDEVVMWCPNCGAVVIDVECDGRTAPGRIMKMLFPKLTWSQG